MTEASAQWAIYENPADYPGKFVLRRCWIVPGNPDPVPDQDCFVADTLHNARSLVPRGFTCLPRFEKDDPSIVEVWI